MDEVYLERSPPSDSEKKSPVEQKEIKHTVRQTCEPGRPKPHVSIKRGLCPVCLVIVASPCGHLRVICPLPNPPSARPRLVCQTGLPIYPRKDVALRAIASHYPCLFIAPAVRSLAITPLPWPILPSPCSLPLPATLTV